MTKTSTERTQPDADLVSLYEDVFNLELYQSQLNDRLAVAVSARQDLLNAAPEDDTSVLQLGALSIEAFELQRERRDVRSQIDSIEADASSAYRGRVAIVESASDSGSITEYAYSESLGMFVVRAYKGRGFLRVRRDPHPQYYMGRIHSLSLPSRLLRLSPLQPTRPRSFADAAVLNNEGGRNLRLHVLTSTTFSLTRGSFGHQVKGVPREGRLFRAWVDRVLPS